MPHYISSIRNDSECCTRTYRQIPFVISRGGQALAEVAHIDLSQLDELCAQLQCLIACDVINPLTGLNRASHIFGPQKGPTPDDAARLDAALAQFAELAHRLTGENHSNSPGYGAAGGTPLGLSLIFKTQIQTGIEMVLEADKVLHGADLVITGGGQMDNQTLQGKTPFGIARKAVSLGIPVIGIAGSLGAESEALMHCFKGIFSALRAPQLLEQVLAEAGMNLQRTASNVAAMLKLGGTIKP
ncbi:glycerate kinase [Enterobacter hormaechei]|uniref:glycerate kinase n=1 Tax=Enterobacter hormaechei TaxID=158836 RepID=UPI0021D1A3D7|nr:glycerate kinase [Enterobacter hormaechei]MCU6154336.1 glycerate kinase [Enterobacter hormaechei]